MRSKLIVGLLVFAGMASCTSSRSLTVSNEAQVRSQLESRKFTVIVDEVLSIGMRQRALVPGYYLKLDGNHMECDLPYFGVIYGNPFPGSYGERLSFQGPVTDYIFTQGKQGRMEVYFKVRTVEDNYNFELIIDPNGDVDLTIRSMHRQQITFYGNIWSS